MIRPRGWALLDLWGDLHWPRRAGNGLFANALPLPHTPAQAGW